MEDRR
jgi:hypothetical protein